MRGIVMAGQPKAPFYFAVFLVVAGLVAFAAYRAMTPKGQANHANANGAKEPQISIPTGGGSGTGGSGSMAGVESPDTASITTVKEYTFKPSQRLPEVKG